LFSTTNVLVAAFRSSIGASYKLLHTLEQRKWRPVVTFNERDLPGRIGSEFA
jgi:hypothetical protein